jgi:hypothetical protein
MIFKRGYVFLWVVLLFAGVVFLAACKGTMGGRQGEGRYEPKRSLKAPNYYEVSVQGEIANIHTAVLAGIKDLGLGVEEDNFDMLSGMTKGAFADNTGFTIKLSRDAEGTVLIQIKVGLTGNKDRSIQLFDAISAHL